MRVNRIRFVVCFIVILCTSCNGRVLELANNAEPTGPNDTETVYYLDSTKPNIVQAIESRDRIQEGCKFVQVEVTRLQNPKKYTLTFKVFYQPTSGEKIYLGSFSPYPADHPGKFIVATQGKLRNEGAIVLSLIIPDDFDSRDTIKVGIKRIKFLKE